MTSGPRLPPVPEESWGEEILEVLEDNSGLLLFRPMPNSVSTLFHHPRLTGAWLPYNAVLLQEPALPYRLRELAILRAMWQTGSRYLWYDHVRTARNLGLVDADFTAITEGAGASHWTPLEAAVVSAADQLVDHYRIDDGTWAELAEELDHTQLLELPFIVGSYVCLSMVFQSAGTEVDDFLLAIPVPGEPPALGAS
jgi:4-carboxymuconolactone decarboxylase